MLIREPTLAKHIMSKKVIMGKPDFSLFDASEKMESNRVGSLIVVDQEGKIIGIITDRDFVKAAFKNLDLNRIKIGDIMSSPVITCNPSTSILEIVELLEKNRIKHLPVIKGGKPVGMVSSRDLIYRGIIPMVLPRR